jgi:hypothetical protein
VSANVQPIFTLTPHIGAARISTANANRDGTGTLGSLFVAGANGSRVERVEITATGTTTAGMIRFFTYDGTNYRAIKEVPVSAITPSASTAAFASEWARTDGYPLMVLPSGWTLYVGTNNAESFDVQAFGGDY